jgi:hypothetical protein
MLAGYYRCEATVNDVAALDEDAVQLVAKIGQILVHLGLLECTKGQPR